MLGARKRSSYCPVSDRRGADGAPGEEAGRQHIYARSQEAWGRDLGFILEAEGRMDGFWSGPATWLPIDRELRHLGFEESRR